ncbi:MAG: OmpA family protein [Kofleriaceae bacterium]|nr:OmpA family protein [Kofleriaceae bacterium]
MASVLVLRGLLGASLGLGAVDLVWINGVLAPQLAPAAEPATLSATPAVEVALPAPPEVVAPPPTDVTSRVYFATRSAKLDERAREELARIAARAGADAEVSLEGHADFRGEEAFNLSLSKARALAVQAELVAHGVAQARVHVGFAGEGTASGGELWRDRRVDIHVRGAR